MFANRIGELRKAKGRTRKWLAEALQTTPLQILQIEVGLQHTRFDVALKICAALDEPLAKLFPKTERPLARMKKRGIEPSEIYGDRQSCDELENAGMDMHPAAWFLQYHLRGGAAGAFPISGPEMRRLHRLLQAEDRDRFIVVSSTQRRFALNPKHLVLSQLLFEQPDTPDGNDESERIEFYLADRGEPLRFDVAPDEKSIEDETADEYSAQLQDLFYYAETAVDRRLMFVDVDGETAFFRTDDVSMFSAPLAMIEPELQEGSEGEDE